LEELGMRKRAWTVAELASASGQDVDQVLLALWEGGIEYPNAPGSRLRPEHARDAELSVGLGGSAVGRVSFWLDQLSTSREALAELLRAHGFDLRPRMKTLPKGAVRVLLALAAPEGERALEIPREADQEEPASPQAAPPLVWKSLGNARECDHLTAAELLQVHEELTRDFAGTDDPISPPGVKSIALLESAAGRPATSYGGSIKYPTAEMAAAALLHSIVQNHPFHNGNKRTALVSMLVFLDRHNLVLSSDQDELFRFMVRVAAHRLLEEGYAYDNVADREVAAIAEWVFARTRQIRREERVVTWRDLQPMLRAQGCEIRVDHGDKFVITRVVRGRRRVFGGHHMDKLESRYINTGDGREVGKKILKRIRQELRLDAEHGIDSENFYGGLKGADFFIVEYSQLLRRLARV
jgi:death-on-curing family protein